MPEPQQRFFESQRLRLAYWTWGDPELPPLMLVHGAGDHARSWDRIAAAFEADHHVIAPDLRGHGDSGWALGNHYGLADVALDLVALAARLGAPVRVIGHSFGARAVFSAAAAAPELFTAIVAIEAAGRGLRSVSWDRTTPGPHELRRWIDASRSLEGKPPRVHPSVEAARDRMLQRHPRLDPDWALHLARHGVKPVDGGYVWKFDSWVHVRLPFEMTGEVLRALWSAIECPVLHVLGAGSDIGRAMTHDQLAIFQRATSVLVPDAGHWVQHDQLAAVIREARSFFAALPGRSVEARPGPEPAQP